MDSLMPQAKSWSELFTRETQPASSWSSKWRISYLNTFCNLGISLDACSVSLRL